MMLERYRTGVRKIDAQTANTVTVMLRIKRCTRKKDSLFKTLDQSGHDQADLVLCLLRMNTRKTLDFAEALVGHEITVCPPALRWRAVPVDPRERLGDDRRLTFVEENPVLRSGRRSWLRRYHLLRVGLSVSQLLRRGVTRGDLRLVLKRGWAKLEQAA